MFDPADKNEVSKLSRDELVSLVMSLKAANESLRQELFGKKSDKRQAHDDFAPLFNEIEASLDEQLESLIPKARQRILTPLRSRGVNAAPPASHSRKHCRGSESSTIYLRQKRIATSTEHNS